MLEHGGNLDDAARRYGLPPEAWLDLSTGINPHPYPVPALPANIWHQLPQQDAALLQAAQAYYGTAALLPVAGTQAAIQALPRLRIRARVAVAAPSYAEHAHRWTVAGHAVREVPYARLAGAVDDCDVMVVCNPNNPTGEAIAPDLLLRWAARLGARGGWLIVDEAYADATPAYGLAQALAATSSAWPAGLIVLRSIGKFFGLAGLRLGFVLARDALLARLADMAGPWSVSGPAQRIGAAALADTDWQATMRARLQADGERLQGSLAAHGMATSGCALFRYWPHAAPDAFADHMAARGIWIRRFAHGVRLGLPPDERGWQRLQAALRAWPHGAT